MIDGLSQLASDASPTIGKAVVEAAFNLARQVCYDRIAAAEAKRIAAKQKKIENENRDIGTKQHSCPSEDRPTRSRLVCTVEDITRALELHIQKRRTWSAKAKTSDLRTSRDLPDIYVHLSLFVYPRSNKLDATDRVESIPFDLISEDLKSHYVILGPTGAGKSSSMRYLFNKIIGPTSSKHTIAIVILFRELNTVVGQAASVGLSFGANNILFTELARILNFSLEFDDLAADDEARFAREEIAKSTLLHLIDALNVVLIFDGLDELSSETHRNIVIEEMSYISANLQRTRIILTCRTAVIRTGFDYMETLEVAPLSEKQVRFFAGKWLGDEQQALSFCEQLSRTPFLDASLRPLFLGYLCTIFQRTGKIPELPKSVYKKIVSLHLEDWDQSNNLQRMSRYAQFDVDRKFDFLSALAFNLTTKFKTSLFTDRMLLECYDAIHENHRLEKTEAKKVVRELESHTSLFLQASSHEYEFIHKSVQEYLTAAYITSLPSVFDIGFSFFDLPEEYAISIALSTNASSFFVSLASNLIYIRATHKETPRFLARLLDRLVQEKPAFRGDAATAVGVSLCYTILSLNSSDAAMREFNVDNTMDKLVQLAGGCVVMRQLLEHYGSPMVEIEPDVFELSITDPLPSYDLPSKIRAKREWVFFN